MYRALAARTFHDAELLRAKALERLGADALLQLRLDVVDDRLVERVHLPARVLDGHARLEPREGVDPVAVTPLPGGKARLQHGAHGDRHIDLRQIAERRPVEPFRGDADDRERDAIDDDRLTNDRRIGTQLRLPVRVAEDGDGMRADGLVVARAQKPASGRPQLKHREVRSRYEHRLGVERLLAEGQVRAESAMRGNAREHGLALLQIPEHRVAQNDSAIAGLVARLGPAVRLGAFEVHQAVWLWDR
jgi:hypothetical protein